MSLPTLRRRRFRRILSSRCIGTERRRWSCLRLLVLRGDRRDHELVLRPRSGRSPGFRTVFVGAVEGFGFGVALELEALGTGSCRSFVPGRCLGIRSLCILGVAGRCRIERGLGTCMGRYCTADFDRRSSRVIHLNTH